MISRKKLPINIWDVIEHKTENVYYMPYSGIHKFLVNTRHCLHCKTELDISFRKNEFIVNTCKCASDGKRISTIKKLSTLFNYDDAATIYQQFSDAKTRKFPNTLKYWIDQGYSNKEAEEKVREIQTIRSKKSPSAQKGAIGYSIRTKEYWIKKGYTDKEAKEKVSELQVTNGLNWYISKYGWIEGRQKYQKRIKGWLESYKKAIENDPTINERKMVSFCNASKESLQVFLPLYNKYKDKVLIYLGIDESCEYFLRDEKTIYFYDFTIPKLNLIVEYNGSKFHPNCDILTEGELKNWRGLFSNESADVVIAKDNVKRKVAENKNYTVITVWDTDDIDESIGKINKLIKERLNEI
jgi:hypothetical protein